MRKAPIAAMLACGFALSVVPAMGQNCTRETPCADKNHHTTAKIVGGSAAGGAVVGGVAFQPRRPHECPLSSPAASRVPHPCVVAAARQQKRKPA